MLATTGGDHRFSVQLTVSFSALSGPPDASIVVALQVNTTSIYLSWEEPADNNAPILTYQITLQVVGSGIGGVSVFTSNTELIVTGLTPFTNYSVQVVAVNIIGTSAPSVLRTVMTAEGSECVSTSAYTCTIKYMFHVLVCMTLLVISSHMSDTWKQLCGRLLVSKDCANTPCMVPGGDLNKQLSTL